MDLPAAGLTLRVLRAGPPGGEPVVLLHGFPESAATCWRRQLGPLAEAGLSLWAPDQRGCGDSPGPPRLRDYHIDRLADDALAVAQAAARAAGRTRAHLVGHDWGGAVAWWAALAAPERLASLTILNCPHPVVLRRALQLGNPRQMARSWYMAFFQLPWLPEALLGARRGALLARGLRDSGRRATAGRPASFAPHELEELRALWSRPGRLRGMIHWYRALRRAPAPPPASPDGRVRVPVRLVWGPLDRALGRELAAPSLALCESGELQWVEGATHWVQHEEPEAVNAAILGWVGRHAPA